ncbi:MAG TPA: ubiquinone/menaquinone biosynthesis methyltransferase [Acidimicrobiales bacterium]|nr:ubiquinone/menaquinone biosynthesis methyltransferase [Acidimicrobiales bacterium]
MLDSLATGELPTGEDKTRRVREMFDAIAPRYDLVNGLMTFGLDARWRTRTVRALGLPHGSLVLDVAAGTGELGDAAARHGHRVVGVDFSGPMLAAARSPRPSLQGDAAALPIATGSVDGVVCGFALRNFTDRPACFAEMARVLRPGGRAALLEVAEPDAALVRAGFHLWFDHVVPRIGGALSDRAAYRYLPKSVAYLPSAEGLRHELVDAGFSGVNRRVLSGGLTQLVTATRARGPS